MKKVLISGASVAGPALAYWLGRYGYDVTVVEGGIENWRALICAFQSAVAVYRSNRAATRRGRRPGGRASR